ncbi:hypothetical protein FSP39_021189 [Pinctada imbricata]|uniref:Hydantoinase/oxoprolinase n=1 Tax=Pinctada imbricata TaxID=66713 RepID=A0AA89BTE1_PINIB|nr:hypothetical protein FSP39_021189 [Pinctada imbricata]
MDRIIPVVVGVDVGGTNTDAVVLEMEKNPPKVLSSAKHPTTHDVFTGITNAITDAINSSLKQQQSLGIVQVNIGTTHFVNAVIQNRDLAKVAVIRLCGTASRGTPPFCDFPDDLKQCIFGGYYMVDGGYEFDGRENSSLNFEEVRKCLDELESKSVRNIVVCGIFSSVKQEQEIQVRNFIKEAKPNFSVTISNEIGQNGLLLRENASILNESLKPLCRKTIQGFRHALESLKLRCPFYLTQNDGTILSADQAEDYPVLTFSSGPTNSMRGAAFLCGIEDAVVIDIGGTTTDVGVLSKGFPRQASFIMEIGNVRTNFRMPDVLSIGLGGGSYIVEDENDGTVTVGPLSAGYNIRNESFVFSDGSMENRKITATDIAVAAGLCVIGNFKYTQDLNKEMVSKALYNIKHLVENAVDKMKTSSEEVPVILVGGGCVILDQTKSLAGASKLITPTHADVANAIGAALSQASNSIEYVVNLEDKINVNEFDSEIRKIDATDDSTKEKMKAKIRKRYIENAHAIAMEESCKKAVDGILQLGVKESSVKIIEKMDVPIAYLPGNATKIGSILFTGKISMVRRETTDGFNKGYLIVEGFDDGGEKVKIDFQNENLVARRLQVGRDHDGEVIGSVPDLITVLESENGEPVPTECVRYGLRVSVLLLPAPSLLKTEKALPVVGPKAFGYKDVDYEPFSDFDESRSVVTEYSKSIKNICELLLMTLGI